MKTYLAKVDDKKYHLHHFDSGVTIGLIQKHGNAWKAYGPDDIASEGESPYHAATNLGYTVDMSKTIQKMIY